jgi:Ca2+-binding EF-hand superfamily protein
MDASAQRGLTKRQSSMKTIPVSLILAGVMANLPVLCRAEDTPATGTGKNSPHNHGQHQRFAEAWKAADADRDGFISKQEFTSLPRIQKLPEENRDRLFARLDKDGDARLSRGELGKLGRPRDGQGPPMQRLAELDADKSGGVSFEEFKAGKVFGKLPPEKQQAVFRRLDSNGDGIISPKDKPQQPFRPGGGKQAGKRQEGAQQASRPIFRRLDLNNDGSLSFEEFRTGPALRDLSEDEQEDRFEALDKNHDQKLTEDELPSPPSRSTD